MLALRRLAVLLAVALLAPAAHAGTPTDDLAWLNEKRSANGIPAVIALDAEWSAACALHVAYMRATGTVTHAQDPSSPAYTAAGNWAGTHAVLASTEPWTATRFIWERAPLHLAQLLAPRLERMGIADDGQLVCATTLPGYTRPAPAGLQVVTYPGNGSRIYPSEIAEEWPSTPAEALGLPQPTGPNLITYRWGGATDDIGVRRVRLDGPAGPLRARWIDRDHPDLGAYLPTGAAIVVPAAPLVRDAYYTALVEYDDGALHVWGFTTFDAPSAAVIRKTRLAARAIGTRRICSRPTPSGCAAWVLRRRVAVDIAGRVLTRASGAPVAGAVVEVRRPDLTFRRTRTDALGGFRIRLLELVPMGQRVLRVSAAVPGDAVRSWPARIRPAAD
jgi:hypothetical protein